MSCLVFVGFFGSLLLGVSRHCYLSFVCNSLLRQCDICVFLSNVSLSDYDLSLVRVLDVPMF